MLHFMESIEDIRRRNENKAFESLYLRKMYRVDGVLECPVFRDVVKGEVISNFNEIVIEGETDRVRMYEEGKGWVMIEQECDEEGKILWRKFVRAEILRSLLDQYQLGEYQIDGWLYWEIMQLMDDPTGYVVQWWKGKRWNEVVL